MIEKLIPQPSIDKNAYSAIYQEIEAYKKLNEELRIEKEELRIKNTQLKKELSEKDQLICELLEKIEKMKSKI